jgi:hypothetical protein
MSANTATQWAERAGLRERILTAWRHVGSVYCEDCETTVDLEAAADESEAAALWNDHVDANGGDRYV